VIRVIGGQSIIFSTLITLVPYPLSIRRGRVLRVRVVNVMQDARVEIFLRIGGQ